MTTLRHSQVISRETVDLNAAVRVRWGDGGVAVRTSRTRSTLSLEPHLAPQPLWNAQVTGIKNEVDGVMASQKWGRRRCIQGLVIH